MEKQIELQENSCRMYIPPEKRGWHGQICIGLSGSCPGTQNCAFYKTEKQYLDEQEKAWRRLKDLSFAQQCYISETYYKGKMPWMALKNDTKEELPDDNPR